MESYADLDLHLQFLCFFRNERLYIDRSNCIQSVFPQCKLQQSKVTNKTITNTKQYRN